MRQCVDSVEQAAPSTEGRVRSARAIAVASRACEAAPQAVILAAGQGARLNGHANGVAKCLMRVGGRSLLEHQLSALHGLRVSDVCVVIGHSAHEVRAHAGDVCSYVENERYRETNSLESLWLVRNWVRGPFVLVNGDVLASTEVYQRVIESPGNALAYDSRSGHELEHMKVRVSSGRLERIGKELPHRSCTGENVGILKFDARAARSLFAVTGALIAQGFVNEWAPAAVDRIAACFTIQAHDVAGLPWIEIDYPCDLIDARETVWPAICGTSRPSSIHPPDLATTTP